MSVLQTTLWAIIGASPSSLVVSQVGTKRLMSKFYVALGLVFTVLLLTVVWSYAATYYEHFGRTDGIVVVGGISLGLVLST